MSWWIRLLLAAVTVAALVADVTWRDAPARRSEQHRNSQPADVARR